MALNSPSRSVAPRFLLTGIALVALSLGTASSHGFYDNTAVLGALVALLAALGACLRGLDAPRKLPPWLGPIVLGAVAVWLVAWGNIADWRRDVARLALVPGVAFLAFQAARGRLRAAPLPLILLATAVLLLSGRAVAYTRIIPGDHPQVLAIRLAAGAGFLLVVAMVGLDLSAADRCGPAFRARLVLLFAAGAVLRLATLAAWPEPSIDVFVWLHDSSHALLAGNNPYTPEQGPLVGLATYPPLPVLLTLPFAALGLDVRLANVVGDLVAALVIYRVARRAGRPLPGALLAGAYLNLPGVPFMLTNAWYEPMLACLLGGGLLLAESGTWGSPLLLGLGLTGKQFGLPLAMPLWGACRGRRAAYLAGIAAAGTLVILPFFLWSPRAFLDAVVYFHLAIGPDVNSLTFRSALSRHLGIMVPGWLAALVTLVLLIWVARRVPERGSRSALWMGTALLVFCLFFVKGYFNYFYLCNYLFLLGLAALDPEGEPAPAATALSPDGGATRLPEWARAA
jgi:hypothetical protein